MRILFDGSDYHLRNVTSTSIDVGGMDELRMGEGEIIVKNIQLSHFKHLHYSSLLTLHR